MLQVSEEREASLSARLFSPAQMLLGHHYRHALRALCKLATLLCLVLP